MFLEGSLLSDNVKLEIEIRENHDIYVQHMIRVLDSYSLSLSQKQPAL